MGWGCASLVCSVCLLMLQGVKADHHHLVNQTIKPNLDIPHNDWFASLGSVSIISLVGLLSIGFVPLLQGQHQHLLLQLLVSMAVGTLVGDALIHLLPHALQADHGEAHSHEEDHSNKEGVWKGFVGTVTIIVFYLVDQLMILIGHGHSHGGPRGRDDESLTNRSSLTSRQASPDISNPPVSPPPKSVNGSLLSLYKPGHTYQSLQESSPTCNVNSSVFMVIIGDCIHNFADGLAVGAAFSSSLTTGVSTSIAVLCHELPHEVGDFALLLQAGCSVKAALLYNCVSSIFAFGGMVIGLLLGSQPGGFSAWLLAATVGVFLYVALVSMMTELRGTKGGFLGILLNVGGMMAGAILLLFIGLYEDQLVHIFHEEPHN